MSSLKPTLEALASVDSLVDTLKACIWKQDKIIREQKEEIDKLKSIVRELEKEGKELRSRLAKERKTGSTASSPDETRSRDERDRWGKMCVDLKLDTINNYLLPLEWTRYKPIFNFSATSSFLYLTDFSICFSLNTVQYVVFKL